MRNYNQLQFILTGRLLPFLLTTFFILISFSGYGQSISIQNFQSNNSRSCYPTGSSISFQVSGTTNTFGGVNISVDYDDGQGFQNEGTATPDSTDYFTKSFSKQYSQNGNYTVKVKISSGLGAADSALVSFKVGNCSTISGTIYQDQNGNCIYDTAEHTFNNRQVLLLDSGVVVQTTQTNILGVYNFYVSGGPFYVVKFADTGSYTNSCPSSGKKTVSNFPAKNIDFGIKNPGRGNSSIAIRNFEVTNSGNCYQTNTSINFQLRGSANTLGPVNVYADFDDGQGLQGVGYSTKDSSGNYSMNLTTQYSQSGNYLVRVKVSSGVVEDSAMISIQVGNCSKLISGRIYHDQNGDCIYDSINDKTLPNRQVLLLDSGIVVQNTMTNSSGEYSFIASGGSNYTVRFVDTGTYSNSCYPSGEQMVTSLPANNINFGIKLQSGSKRVIKGNVEVNNSSLTSGKVRLWKRQDSIYLVIDSLDLQVSDNGVYEFSQIDSGKYIIQAFADSGLQLTTKKIIPTYHDSTIQWDNATIVNVDTGNKTYSAPVQMFTSKKDTGSGVIRGTVVQLGNGKRLEPGDPLGGVEVLALTDGGDPVDYAISNPKGVFTFKNMALDTYLLKVEVPGLIAEGANVILSEDNKEVDSVRFSIDKKQGRVNLIKWPEQKAESNAFSSYSIYPNPARNWVRMKVRSQKPRQVSLTVWNSMGQKVKTKRLTVKSGYNVYRFRTNRLKKGVYILELQSRNKGDGRSLQKLIVR